MKPPYSRVRTDSSPVPFQVYSHINVTTRKNASILTTTTPYSVLLPGGFNGGVMSDIVTPGFREKVANGAIINNPMSKEERWTTVSETVNGLISKWENLRSNLADGASLTSTLSAVNQVIIPANSSSPIWPNMPIDTAYVQDTILQQAVNDCAANAHQRNVMGMVDLKEMGKTVDMLRTQAGRIEKFLNGVPITGKYTRSRSRRASKQSLMHYRGRSALGRIADAAGLHLEVNYGLIPLMLSIEGLVKSLGTQSLESARLTFRGSDSWNTEDESVKVTTGVSNTVSLTQTCTITQSVQAHARAGMLTTYSPSLKAMLGLEGRDIVPSAYDLLPYSFVIDWFFDMGTYLEAVTPVPGFNSLTSWVTVFVKEEITYRYHRNGGSATINNGMDRWTYGEYSSEVSTYRYLKQRSTNVPVALPHFRSDLKSINHLISGAALALSSVTKSRAFRKHLYSK